MKTRSYLQRHTPDSSDRLTASIQPRSWGDPIQERADQPQPTSHDFSHVDLFAHDPGPRPNPQWWRSQPAFVQAKLTVGAPNDQYEQEADRVASQVVQRLQSPQMDSSQAQQSVQRETLPEEDELQMKPLVDQIQRVEMPEEDELQMKPDELQRETLPEDDELQMKPMLQMKGGGAIAVGEASTDFESAINSARGGGQSLDADLQRSIGQALGADFSGVRVHTDSQSDQLNQSIQAKAFTTGQDVFFRQGAYELGSRGGQELIAHELTHVVQQNGGAVQRVSMDTHSNGCCCPGCSGSGKDLLLGSLPQPQSNYLMRNGDDSDSDYEDPGGDMYQSNLCDDTGMLLPKYQKKVRRYFYPSGYTVSTNQWKKQELKKIKTKTPMGKVRYKCPKCQQLKSKSDMTIDHKIPVSKHWNKVGHDQTQPNRSGWYNNTNNHKVICGSCNSSKGGESYTPQVGPNFLGSPENEANP
jgi:5-methylcytosine-specific restriction endonuclease McrA